MLTCNRAGNGSGGGKFANFVVNRYVEVKAIDSNYIDAVFLGNHDTGRPAGFLKYNENAVKFGAALQFFTPGKTFVYYGDELGMTGTGKDENKRAPMYWTENENTAGMTKGPSAMENRNTDLVRTRHRKMISYLFITIIKKHFLSKMLSLQ